MRPAAASLQQLSSSGGTYESNLTDSCRVGPVTTCCARAEGLSAQDARTVRQLRGLVATAIAVLTVTLVPAVFGSAPSMLHLGGNVVVAALVWAALAEIHVYATDTRRVVVPAATTLLCVAGVASTVAIALPVIQLRCRQPRPLANLPSLPNDQPVAARRDRRLETSSDSAPFDSRTTPDDDGARAAVA